MLRFVCVLDRVKYEIGFHGLPSSIHLQLLPAFCLFLRSYGHSTPFAIVRSFCRSKLSQCISSALLQCRPSSDIRFNACQQVKYVNLCKLVDGWGGGGKTERVRERCRQ